MLPKREWLFLVGVCVAVAAACLTRIDAPVSLAALEERRLSREVNATSATNASAGSCAVPQICIETGFGPFPDGSSRAGVDQITRRDRLWIRSQGMTAVCEVARIKPRPRGGFKIDLGREERWRGMQRFNLTYEGSLRQLLAESFAFEIFQEAGVPTPFRFFCRVNCNGVDMEPMLLIEEVGEGLLDRHELRHAALFKAGYTDSFAPTYTPSNRRAMQDAKLWTNAGASMAAVQTNSLSWVRAVRYFAVSHCLANWDGFANNHFIAIENTNITFIPWDLDKTWGESEGRVDRDWFDMPLQYGASLAPFSNVVVFGQSFVASHWWRPPGALSGEFLQRHQTANAVRNDIQLLCRTIFTDAFLFPRLDRLTEELITTFALSRRASDYETVIRKDCQAIKEFIKRRKCYLIDNA